MARVCAICGKRPGVGHKVSNSAHKTKRRWYPNLQTAHAWIDGRPARVKVCTACLKAGKVQKVVRRSGQRTA
ncbi:MAG: 50S ribosomal protein L28 [Armatimonadetes bacterium]|nr:50S ribosomal protein L28 [Armatimonadota bacterium]